MSLRLSNSLCGQSRRSEHAPDGTELNIINDAYRRLSQMILDKVFFGILDQGAGCLIVFEEPQEDKTYDAALDTFKHVGQVVESLYAKAIKTR